MKIKDYDITQVKIMEFLADSEIEFECKWIRDRQLVFTIDFGLGDHEHKAKKTEIVKITRCPCVEHNPGETVTMHLKAEHGDLRVVMESEEARGMAKTILMALLAQKQQAEKGEQLERLANCLEEEKS